MAYFFINVIYFEILKTKRVSPNGIYSSIEIQPSVCPFNHFPSPPSSTPNTPSTNPPVLPQPAKKLEKGVRGLNQSIVQRLSPYVIPLTSFYPFIYPHFLSLVPSHLSHLLFCPYFLNSFRTFPLNHKVINLFNSLITLCPNPLISQLQLSSSRTLKLCLSSYGFSYIAISLALFLRIP